MTTWPGRVEEGSGGSLGQAVGVQQVDAEVVEVARDDRIEARAASDEVAHVACRRLRGSCPKNSLPALSPNLRRKPVHAHQVAQHRLGDSPALGDFFKDALVDQVEELRHHGEDGDLALLQRPQQFGGVQRFEVDHARAFHQRQQQVRHLRQHVEHGQDAQHRVGRADLQQAENRIHFTQQVGVRELHTLGIGRGAGSVEQGGHIVGGRFDGAEVARAGGEDGVQIADPAGAGQVFLIGGCFKAAWVGENQIHFQSADGLLCDSEMLDIGDEQGSATVFEEFGDLVGVEGGVEGNGSVAGGDDAQVGGNPARVVVGEDGDARAGGELLLREPAPHGFGHLAGLGVGVALDLVLALDFEGDVLGAALFGFDKLVVESGHERRGKYT